MLKLKSSIFVYNLLSIYWANTEYLLFSFWIGMSEKPTILNMGNKASAMYILYSKVILGKPAILFSLAIYSYSPTIPTYISSVLNIYYSVSESECLMLLYPRKNVHKVCWYSQFFATCRSNVFSALNIFLQIILLGYLVCS